MIKASNIEKSYNGERVLFGVSLEIARGEFVSIMGESGSGKSTLLSILGGFLDPDAGEVQLGGRALSAMSEHQLSALRCRELGFVFQGYRLIPTLNVRDNLFLPARLGKKREEELEAYAKEISETLGISSLYKKFPEQLSGGQCQRVAIARALLYQPRVLILDEPTGALDSAMEKTVMELLVKTNRELGTTVVQVTHSPTVAAYGTRTVYLRDGKLV